MAFQQFFSHSEPLADICDRVKIRIDQIVNVKSLWAVIVFISLQIHSVASDKAVE